MPEPKSLPEGFVRISAVDGELIVRHDRTGAIRAAGLDRPEGWVDRLVRTPGAPGRGGSARVELNDGTKLVLKKLRRGGLAAPLWRDRFPGMRRLSANLDVPSEAERRGIPTPAVVALFVREGPPGLFQAWLAVEEISGAVDLRTRLGQPPVPDETRIRAVLRCVRRSHDAGLRHPDLNVGNLMVREDPAGTGWDVWIIDLDRAALEPGAVSFAHRVSALRRLERSYFKEFGDAGPLPKPVLARWFEWYADGDSVLAKRLESSRTAGRLLLGVHRLGWSHRSRGRAG